MDKFYLQPWVWRAVIGSLGIIVALRFAAAVRALQWGNETALLTLPLGVLLPALLVAALMRMEPTQTREGLLMRLGTAVHLLLIVAVPPLALHLALGLPVVFLIVELFETRLPVTIHDRIMGLVLA